MSHHRKGRNPDANKLIIYHNPTGSATFDPTITTSVSTTVIWETEVGRTVTTGTTHDLSYTPTAGAKVCKVTVIGGLRLVSGVDFRDDVITSVMRIGRVRLASPNDMVMFSNSSLAFDLVEVGSGSCRYFRIDVTAIYGDIANLPPGIVEFRGDAYIRGALDGLAKQGSTLWTCYLFSNSLIFPGSIAPLVAIRNLRIYSMGWNQAGVDTVISSAWGARAAYTYSSISLQIGGTNAAPSGNKVAPVEGSDWHEDTPGHWVPLTANAMVYDLLNDVNSEGFNKWFSITTS